MSCDSSDGFMPLFVLKSMFAIYPPSEVTDTTAFRWRALTHLRGPAHRFISSPSKPRSTVLARGSHHAGPHNAGPPLQLQYPASAGLQVRFGTHRRQRESFTIALRGGRAQQDRCNRIGGHRQSEPAQ